MKKTNDSNIQKLRTQAAAHGIFTIAELARRWKCSTTSIYSAVENPSHFPRVAKRIKEMIGA